MENYDHLWAFINPLVPAPAKPKGPGGRPRVSDEQLFRGMMWVLRSGARWKDMPREFGSYQTAHRRFQEWVVAGVFSKAYDVIIEYARSRGLINLEEAFIDGTFSQAKKGERYRADKEGKRQQNHGHLRRKRPAHFIGDHRRQPS